MNQISDEKSSIYGKLMILEGMIILVPIICILFWKEEAGLIFAFLIPGSVSVLAGFIICKLFVSDGKEKWKEKSWTIVLFAWVYGFFIATIPFLALNGYSLTQVIFESVSGFTTTGLSVLNVTTMPHIFLFYRSFLQFVGGVGFVMMMLVFIQGKASMLLYSAEGHPDKIMPSIGKTARAIVGMYSAFLVIGTIMYCVVGMPLFDSIIHTMCALSTGGFSNKLNSIGEYNSFAIELVTIFLMLLGTTNFAVLLLLVRGKWKQFFKVSEMRFLGILILVFVPLLSYFLVIQNSYGITGALRTSLFNAFSALSTTGYATCSYSDWGAGALGIMILLMLIGGGIGSTAGGLKLSRVYLVLRMIIFNIKTKISSEHRVITMYYGKPSDEKCRIGKNVLDEAANYILLYLLVYIVGVLALCASSDCGLAEAMFEFASALGTVGLSIGITSYTANAATLWIEIAGMVLGRLEIYTIFIGIYNGYKYYIRK